MAKFWVEQQTSPKTNVTQKTKCPEKKEEKGLFNKLFHNTSLSSLNRFALLNHRAIPAAAFAQKHTQKTNKLNKQDDTKEKTAQPKQLTIKDMMFNSKAPLVVAISHSDRAASFHQSNGFQPVSRIPFHDEKEDVTPFYTHVLVLDPFCTGKLQELTSGLTNDSKKSIGEPLSLLHENLQHSSMSNSGLLV